MKPIFTSLIVSGLVLGSIESKASEFFIKIFRAGQHTVLVNDQYQTNSTNVYRFFELPAGTANIKISDANTGSMVFEGTLNLGIDERVVAEMNATGNISVVSTYTVSYTNWYTQNTPNTTVNNPPVVSTPPPPPPPAQVGCNPEKFKEIVATIKAQRVESYKLDKAKSIVKKDQFSAKQVAEICKLFSVESYKLDFAKYAYDYTADKDNYFLVGKVFNVASYSRDLDEYIDKK